MNVPPESRGGCPGSGRGGGTAGRRRGGAAGQGRNGDNSEGKLGRAVKSGTSEVAGNLAAVRERIGAAARRAGRDPAAVTVVGITKGVEPARIGEAIRAGLADVGENKIQEWLPKISAAGASARWHYVGRLQTNKVRYLVRGVSVLHSLDRPDLLTAIERRWDDWAAGLAQAAYDAGRGSGVGAGSSGGPVCLVQVNVAGEATKAGVAPGELNGFLERLAAGGRIRVSGLMTVAPYTDEPEKVRWVFAGLRRLLDQARRDFPHLGLQHLSMGMSGDYEVAVEEGATMVRIGTAIFGARR